MARLPYIRALLRLYHLTKNRNKSASALAYHADRMAIVRPLGHKWAIIRARSLMVSFELVAMELQQTNSN